MPNSLNKGSTLLIIECTTHRTSCMYSHKNISNSKLLLHRRCCMFRQSIDSAVNTIIRLYSAENFVQLRMVRSVFNVADFGLNRCESRQIIVSETGYK